MGAPDCDHHVQRSSATGPSHVVCGARVQDRLEEEDEEVDNRLQEVEDGPQAKGRLLLQHLACSSGRGRRRRRSAAASGRWALARVVEARAAAGCQHPLPAPAALLRLLEAGWPLEGASDHGVSEALYLRDPDGNLVEVSEYA